MMSARPHWIRPHGWRSGLLVMLLAAACGFAGCIGGATHETEPDAAERSDRIEVLRLAIARDHANLEDLITAPPDDELAKPEHDAKLREVGKRLVAHQHELAGLLSLELNDAE